MWGYSTALVFYLAQMFHGHHDESREREGSNSSVRTECETIQTFSYLVTRYGMSHFCAISPINNSTIHIAFNLIENGQFFLFSR